jgi:hypothetical protein
LLQAVTAAVWVAPSTWPPIPWPLYAPVAAEAGIAPARPEVYPHRTSCGGLNLYARRHEAFGYRDNLAELFATPATLQWATPTS